MARRQPSGRISAASGSPTSGTWGGCTTCWSTRTKDPVHRRWQHNLVTFSMLYAFTENFILPFSHDEVVHGKGALLDKMPGDVWQKYATLRDALRLHVRRTRARSCCSWAASSASGASGTTIDSLDWHLLDDPAHAGLRRFVQALNWHYRAEPALHEMDFDAGRLPLDRLQRQREQRRVVRAVRAQDPQRLRRDGLQLHAGAARRLSHRRAGAGYYAELLNSDSRDLRRQQRRQRRRCAAREPIAAHGFDHSIRLMVPPLGCLLLKKHA